MQDGLIYKKQKLYASFIARNVIAYNYNHVYVKIM